MDSTEHETPLTERRVLRRGLIAGIAAFGAAAALKVTGKTPTAEAVHQVEDLGIDLVNNGTQRTFLVASVQGNPPMVIFNGSGPFSIGQADAIQGITRSQTGFAAGVQGRNQSAAGQSIGVYGTTSSTSGTGVFGTSGLLGSNVPPEATGTGVYGTGHTFGVRGTSPNGVGVRGDSDDTFGVFGHSSFSDGIRGESFAGRGVVGASSSFVGVIGFSDNSTGVYGWTAAPGVAAIIGESVAPSNQQAGYFQGSVVVNGNFQVLGVKNAVVPMADGSHAQVYCQESPEPYFEDFGRANLVNGVAQVNIEPQFAGIVHRDDYMVFLTPSGDSNGLFVSTQNPQGFEVREAKGGKGNLPFTYRIVARRRDVKVERLQRVDPQILKMTERIKEKGQVKDDLLEKGGRKASAATGPLVPEIPAGGGSVPPSQPGGR